MDDKPDALTIIQGFMLQLFGDSVVITNPQGYAMSLPRDVVRAFGTFIAEEDTHGTT
jgi:hypothetical protein